MFTIDQVSLVLNPPLPPPTSPASPVDGVWGETGRFILRSICEHADSMSSVACSLVNNHLRSFYPPQWSKTGVVRWLSDFRRSNCNTFRSGKRSFETWDKFPRKLLSSRRLKCKLQIITQHAPRHGFKAWKQKTWRLESNYSTTESEKPLWVSLSLLLLFT